MKSGNDVTRTARRSDPAGLGLRFAFVGVPDFGKDHESTGRLQSGDDEDFLGGADFFGAVVDDDHGAIGEVTDALVFVFAGAHDGEVDFFADHDSRFERVGEFVDVEDFGVLEAGDFAEIFVGGEQARAEHASDLDEPGIHAVAIGFVRAVVNGDVDLFVRLHFLQAVEPALTTLAFGRGG